MFMEERQKDIIKILNQTGRILVSEIQERSQTQGDLPRSDVQSGRYRGSADRLSGGRQEGGGVHRGQGRHLYHHVAGRLLYG